ncbi:hypothetical protein C3Y87_08000 [Carbonactinospora thermoautotrophica]|uniref:ATP-grasp peptide maturase system methyltransferase n=1 Tax=Carbonactinospora thermoautotrophica TaxID=1469144 RepID=UPI0022718917|nr:ATP-grasp peptide maturase system methyltransferase [Carbonactinospora thermoautotrophica]MCX9191356.1 hypothetical protein [Carbonactinospora thermoautotrophica]
MPDATPQHSQDVAERLARLAEELAKDGSLRTEPWRAALLAVPRHVFVPRFYLPRNGPRGTEWVPVTPATHDEDERLDLAYRNETLVTQIDGESWQTPTPRTGRPTSSSTLPGLVVRMLEELDVHEGMRVLEIGTGTGYSTALLCHRLGDGNVVSIEYDQAVAGRAQEALAALGYHPTLVVGDGAHGHPARAPYDRVIATCAFTHLPYAWVEQSRPGAKILTTFNGRQLASAMVRLEVGDDGTAKGRFYPDTISFMISRPQVPASEPVVLCEGMFEREGERIVDFDPAWFDDWTFRFLFQCRFPNLRTGVIRLQGDQEWTTAITDPDTGAWATYRLTEGGRLAVRESEPGGLWTRVEQTFRDWESLGRPGIEKFELTVTPDEQSFRVPGSGIRWHLPR